MAGNVIAYVCAYAYVCMWCICAHCICASGYHTYCTCYCTVAQFFLHHCSLQVETLVNLNGRYGFYSIRWFNMLRWIRSYVTVFLPFLKFLPSLGISSFGSLATAVNRHLLFKLKFRYHSFSKHFKPKFSFISFFVCLINLRIVFNNAFYRCHCITKLFKSMGKM